MTGFGVLGYNLLLLIGIASRVDHASFFYKQILRTCL